MPAERRVAWVTGAGRGIGRACAVALAEAGHDVALSARSEEELRRVAEECTKRGVRAQVFPLDVTDAGAVARIHQGIVAALGAPAVLVNAAGVAKSAPFLRTTPEMMEEHWRLNVMGVFHATQAALPAMIEAGWGRVVTIASVAGKAGAPYISAYAASKHAVLGLTRSLATEVATSGVTVNAVCPGYVDTPMTEGTIENMTRRTGMSREEAIAKLASMSPQKRLIDPEEVASLVVHLASPAARGIHGQALTLDGGALQW